MKKARHLPGEVSVTVKGKNLPITAALREQVVHKMGRLDRYLDKLQEIEVELSTEKTRDSDHHNHVEATTHVLGRVVRVTAIHADMYAAIDQCVDKLYRQLNRQKERMKSHHGTRWVDSLVDDGVPVGRDLEQERVPLNGHEPQIQRETIESEPMLEEDAVAELRGQELSFYVFINAHSNQVNVVYRRDDGDFGLIQPRKR